MAVAGCIAVGQAGPYLAGAGSVDASISGVVQHCNTRIVRTEIP